MMTFATEDFLVHLQQRLALTEEAAARTLAGWLSSYEPGPAALAHRGSAAVHGESTPQRLRAGQASV